MATTTSWEDLWNSLKGASSPGTTYAWLGQAASPLVPASQAYKNQINESVENINQILPQYENFVTSLPNTFNQLATNTQTKFEPLYSNLNNLYNQLFGNMTSATSGISTYTPQFLSNVNSALNSLRSSANMTSQELAGAKPVYGASLGNIFDLYQQIRNTVANIPINNQMLNTVWQQYNDVYNALRDTQRRTQTGELSPQTQEWINKLGESLRQEMDTELSDVYRNDIRGLLANLAERGIVTSGQANQAFTQAADKYLKQKQIGESKIAQQLAQAALTLPFQQFEAAKNALAAPQIGGQLAELYSAVFSKLAPFYETALKAAAMPATTVSDYLGKVADVATAQTAASKYLSDAAVNLFTPSTTTAELANVLSNALQNYGQSQYGGLSSITTALANAFAQGSAATHTGFANLLEQYTQMPDKLTGTAFDRYGGLGTALAKMLTDKYIAEKQIAASKDIKNMEADAASDAALWSALGGLVGDIFGW